MSVARGERGALRSVARKVFFLGKTRVTVWSAWFDQDWATGLISCSIYRLWRFFTVQLDPVGLVKDCLEAVTGWVRFLDYPQLDA